jgi:hypothetical protein
MRPLTVVVRVTSNGVVDICIITSALQKQSSIAHILNPALRRPVSIFFCAELQKSAKIASFDWRPGRILLINILDNLLVRCLLAEILILLSIGLHPQCFNRRTIRVSQRQQAKATLP